MGNHNKISPSKLAKKKTKKNTELWEIIIKQNIPQQVRLQNSTLAHCLCKATSTQILAFHPIAQTVEHALCNSHAHKMKRVSRTISHNHHKSRTHLPALYKTC